MYCLLVVDYDEKGKYKSWFLDQANYRPKMAKTSTPKKGLIKLIQSIRDKMAENVSKCQNKHVKVSDDRMVIAEMAIKDMDRAEELLYETRIA